MDVAQVSGFIVAGLAGLGAFIRELQHRSKRPSFSRGLEKEDSVEARLAKAAMDELPDALFVVDTRGTIILVNKTTELFFGYHRTELKGREIEMLVPERFRSGHSVKRRSFWSDPHMRQMGHESFPGMTRDGEEIQLEIMLAPLVLDVGRYVIGVARKQSRK